MQICQNWISTYHLGQKWSGQNWPYSICITKVLTMGTLQYYMASIQFTTKIYLIKDKKQHKNLRFIAKVAGMWSFHASYYWQREAL